jgi:hypothetical protein
MSRLPAVVDGGQTLTPDRSDLVVLIDPDRLKAACVARGWSLSELSRQAKVSVQPLQPCFVGSQCAHGPRGRSDAR